LSAVDRRRAHARELQALELEACRLAVADPAWLAPADESALRYALSLARLSCVPVTGARGAPVVGLGPATDSYRRRLWDLLAPALWSHTVPRADLPELCRRVRELARGERADLLRALGPVLTAEALDGAVRTRPFALTLGGGGGTCHVFMGAMWELHDAGLTPDLLAGTSMGALLGAFRARQRDFPMERMRKVLRDLTWRDVFRFLDTESRYGVPATLKLHLRAALGEHFTVDGRVLTLAEMEIPLRVMVGGLAEVDQPERYAHLLDGISDSWRSLRLGTTEVARALAELAAKPARPVLLGSDDLTAGFDVVDAMGFSAAVPGVIQYDLLRDDPRMHGLLRALLARERVSRLVDGGLADNLPARAAWDAVQAGAVGARDPFVLALDSFEPRLSLGTNLFFYPLMQIAYENSKAGRRAAHLVVSFKEVLSPLAVVPTPEQMDWAVARGRAEMAPHVPLLRKILGPIPRDSGVA
jgi:predicted acylesterase/phospholipase RssA